MIYAYIRVSTDKQTVENQRFEINRFAKQRDFQIDVWVEETVSGTRSAKDRKLGVLLKRIKKGDTLIVSEISRLGRRLMEVMSILNACMLKNVILLTVKEKYELGNNIQSQILAFAFSLSAQIERDLISPNVPVRDLHAESPPDKSWDVPWEDITRNINLREKKKKLRLCWRREPVRRRWRGN